MSLAEPGPGEQVPQTVKLRRGHRRVAQKYRAGETLFETSCRAGLPIQTNCRSGLCGTCVVKLLRGKVRMLRNCALDEEQVASGLVLGCQSIPVSAECEISYD